jgi:neutral ceramidase
VRDWDLDDTVYRDRREDNDELAVWDDVEPGYGKDPWLGVVRIDDTLGQPLAAIFNFGIHGTSLGMDSSMVSTDAPGHVELALEDHFDSDVVVMHVQGAGGDAAPAGGHSDYAKLEGLGERASGLLMDAWEATPTSSDPIRLESASRHFPQSLEDITVTRGGQVDLYYKSYEEYYVADELVYDAEGKILSPIDEFNTQYGAVFCGADIPLIPSVTIGVEVYPYSACTDVATVATVIEGFFDLESGTIPLPMPSTKGAGVLATRIGPLTTSTGSGEIVQRELIAGFFPGEPTGMFVEQWRRSVYSELGWEQAMMVGYSQDHEGYLLLPEDWLLGGYEPNINVWGPLQAEYLMEETVEMIDSVLGNDLLEPADPDGRWSPTVYPEVELDIHFPDATTMAGTVLSEAPEYLWLPLDLTVDLVTPETLERGTGMVQLVWQGGDPSVDSPRVVLERLVDDEWVEATGPSGRLITDTTPAILVSHTPYPLEKGSPDREHVWWASWQAVGSSIDRLGLPLGHYRLAVSGQYYESGDSGWPWQIAPYSLIGDGFDLEVATISIAQTSGGVDLWMEAPSNGWRLIDENGEHRGNNGIFGTVSFEFETEFGPVVEVIEPTVSGNKSFASVDIPDSATSLVVVDQYGNRGELSL